MENKIVSLNPKFLDSINSVIAEMRARKYIIALHSGIRLPEYQNNLYAIGRTVINPDGDGVTKEKPFGDTVTNARAWESYHFFGLAGDLVFKNDKGWTWDGYPKHYKDKDGLWVTEWDENNKWCQLAVVGEIFGLSAGARWHSKTRPDFPHFELKGKITNIHEAKRIYDEQGVDALWALV